MSLLGRLLFLALLLAGGSAAAFQPAPSQVIRSTGTVELAFSPWNNPEEAIVEAVAAARRAVYVQAFLFTSKPVAQALIDAHERGVKVEVLLDAEMNRRGSLSVLPELLAAGIPVAVETRYNSAHNKVMVVDPETPGGAVVTGSYNFTRSARVSNAENLLILRGNPQLTRAYLDNWRRHRAEALPIRTLEDLPQRHARERDRKPVE